MGSQVVLLTDISSVLLPSVSTTLTKDELVTRLQLFENGILKLLVGLRTRILSSVPKLNLKSFSSQEHLPCSKDSSFFSELLSESLNSLTKELLSHWSRRNDSGVTIPLLSKPPYEMLQKALEEIAVLIDWDSPDLSSPVSGKIRSQSPTNQIFIAMKLPTNQTEMNHFLSLASDSKDISSPDIALKLKSLFDSTVLNQAFRVNPKVRLNIVDTTCLHLNVKEVDQLAIYRGLFGKALSKYRGCVIPLETLSGYYQEEKAYTMTQPWFIPVLDPAFERFALSQTPENKRTKLKSTDDPKKSGNHCSQHAQIEPSASNSIEATGGPSSVIRKRLPVSPLHQDLCKSNDESGEDVRKKLKRVPSRDERELESAEVENNNAIIPPSGFQKGEEGIRPRAIVGQSVLVLQDDATECACVFQDDCDAFQSSLLSSVQNLDGESAIQKLLEAQTYIQSNSEPDSTLLAIARATIRTLDDISESKQGLALDILRSKFLADVSRPNNNETAFGDIKSYHVPEPEFRLQSHKLQAFYRLEFCHHFLAKGEVRHDLIRETLCLLKTALFAHSDHFLSTVLRKVYFSTLNDDLLFFSNHLSKSISTDLGNVSAELCPFKRRYESPVTVTICTPMDEVTSSPGKDDRFELAPVKMNWIPEQPKVGVRVVNDSPPSIMDIIPKTAREQWADDHCCASDAQIEDHQRDLDVALIHGLEMNKSVLETHLLNLKWKRQELIKSARLKKASSRFSNESGDLFKEREEFRGQSHCCPSDSNPDYHHVGKDESCLSKSLRRGKRDKSFGNLGNSSKKMGCSLLGWKSFRQVPLGFDQDCHGFPSDDSSGYEPSPIASYEDEVDMRGKTFGMKAALNKEILEDLGLFERELFEMDSAQMTVIINRDLENELKELSAI